MILMNFAGDNNFDKMVKKLAEVGVFILKMNLNDEEQRDEKVI